MIKNIKDVFEKYDLEHVNKLTYDKTLTSATNNYYNASIADEEIQVMPKNIGETLKKFRELIERFQYPPLKIVLSEKYDGYKVIA